MGRRIYNRRFNMVDFSKLKTNMWHEFTVAELKGIKGVQEHFKKVFDELKKAKDVEKLTELVLVTNWKCWDHYDMFHTKMSEAYSTLYYKAHNWCCSHFKGQDMDYYFNMVD